MNDTLSPPGSAGGDGSESLTDAEMGLLASAYEALMARLPKERNSDAFIELGRAVWAGKGSARRIIARYGLTMMIERLTTSAMALRNTGHFTDASLVELLADVVMSWERRAVRRNSRPH